MMRHEMCFADMEASEAGFAPNDKRLGPLASSMLMNDNVEVA